MNETDVEAAKAEHATNAKLTAGHPFAHGTIVVTASDVTVVEDQTAVASAEMTAPDPTPEAADRAIAHAVETARAAAEEKEKDKKIATKGDAK